MQKNKWFSFSDCLIKNVLSLVVKETHDNPSLEFHHTHLVYQQKKHFLLTLLIKILKNIK
ncbi:hypothetical protein NUITMVRE36_20180 [Enterococcus raffinosus]|nr:hypothetical protein NUITMVRE36_20180 [Enterococcus raffinosus]